MSSEAPDLSKIRTAYLCLKKLLLNISYISTPSDANEREYAGLQDSLKTALTAAKKEPPRHFDGLSMWIDFVRYNLVRQTEREICIDSVYHSVVRLLENESGELDRRERDEYAQHLAIYDRVKKSFPEHFGDEAELLAWLLIRSLTKETDGALHIYKLSSTVGDVVIKQIRAPIRILESVQGSPIRMLRNSGFLETRDFAYVLTPKSFGFLGLSEAMQAPSSPISNELNSAVTARNKLRDWMIEVLGTDDLKDICFALGIDDETLEFKEKKTFTRELIKFCQKTDRRKTLMKALATYREHPNWSEFDAWANG